MTTRRSLLLTTLWWPSVTLSSRLQGEVDEVQPGIYLGRLRNRRAGYGVASASHEAADGPAWEGTGTSG